MRQKVAALFPATDRGFTALFWRVNGGAPTGPSCRVNDKTSTTWYSQRVEATCHWQWGSFGTVLVFPTAGGGWRSRFPSGWRAATCSRMAGQALGRRRQRCVLLAGEGDSGRRRGSSGSSSVHPPRSDAAIRADCSVMTSRSSPLVRRSVPSTLSMCCSPTVPHRDLHEPEPRPAAFLPGGERRLLRILTTSLPSHPRRTDAGAPPPPVRHPTTAKSARNISESWRAARVLGSKGIPNRVDSWGPQWAHDWPLWRAMLPGYLADVA